MRAKDSVYSTTDDEEFRETLDIFQNAGDDWRCLLLEGSATPVVQLSLRYLLEASPHDGLVSAPCLLAL